MKQAVLITAYHNVENLNRLIDLFNEDFNVYIHIDVKSGIEMDTTRHNVFVYREFNINWGGIAHVDAILFLCEQALCEKQNERFHLISGDDYPILSTDAFVDFFSKQKDVNFLEYFKLPYENWDGEGGMERIKYYHPLDRLNIKDTDDFDIYMRYLSLQKYKGTNRELPDINLYGGSTWWSLNRLCVEYIIHNKNKYNLYNRLKDTFVPEEIYIPTLLLNSPLASTIKNDNLRYISWHFKHNNIPAILDEQDLVEISRSKYFFIRKIDPNISRKLIEQIEKNNDFYKTIRKCSSKGSEDLISLLYQYLDQEYDNISLKNLSQGKLGVLLSLYIYEKLHTIKRQPTIRTCKRFIEILNESALYPLELLFEIGIGLSTLVNNNLCNINSDNLTSQLDRFAIKLLETTDNIQQSVIIYANLRKLIFLQKCNINFCEKKYTIERVPNFSSLPLKHYPYGIWGFAGIMLILLESLYGDLKINHLYFIK